MRRPKRLYDLLATPAGGLIGYVEEYGCMGMSRENYLACARPSAGSSRRAVATAQLA